MAAGHPEQLDPVVVNVVTESAFVDRPDARAKTRTASPIQIERFVIGSPKRIRYSWGNVSNWATKGSGEAAL